MYGQSSYRVYACVLIQGVLSMPVEVLNCEILHKFLTQTDMDREDELFNKRVSEIQGRNCHKTS